jgi:hypothetical protein
VISEEQEEMIRQHFHELPWLEFLADRYLCVEALRSEAVENIVPLADPGTRESLHVPLSDEQDHIAFGINRLRQELAELAIGRGETFLASIPSRIYRLTDAFHGLELDLAHLSPAGCCVSGKKRLGTSGISRYLGIPSGARRPRIPKLSLIRLAQ